MNYTIYTLLFIFISYIYINGLAFDATRSSFFPVALHSSRRSFTSELIMASVMVSSSCSRKPSATEFTMMSSMPPVSIKKVTPVLAVMIHSTIFGMSTTQTSLRERVDTSIWGSRRSPASKSSRNLETSGDFQAVLKSSACRPPSPLPPSANAPWTRCSHHHPEALRKREGRGDVASSPNLNQGSAALGM